ncbi:riboflavin biosynthesis protein RibD [Moraxella osloensis]|nr:bifunctional diaminohydroxyphosphoribosylaminopyrimidine deaminase/5-amino-6-(5-phosphoribosylamino)uracil reductase RibD [Moraxella osloensis]ATW72106.1 riboflavin biosynthesis protein RibD [Moraxella osloensis]
MTATLSSAERYQHQYYMSRAIELAKKGRFTTRPNPNVGCVIVKDNQIIGEGFHYLAGQPHAEVFALRQAYEHYAKHLQGATAYVTLEPCSHHGRTPPCADALIKAGISRVVIAVVDPNPKVDGGGIAKLQQAGIEVITGICEQAAYQLNEGFFKVMRGGLPFVRLKIATSLDGRTAMANGESKWITNEQSREDVQRLRAQAGAIITGSETILQDHPALNIRSQQLGVNLDDIPQPLLVVLDRRQRIQMTDTWYQSQITHRPVLLIQDAAISLTQLLISLKDNYQINDVLVEAGATVAASFLLQGLVDELVVYQAPCFLGNSAKPMINFNAQHIHQQIIATLVSHETMGNDIKLTYRFDK